MSHVVLKNVSKKFDDVVAVQDLSFEVKPGSIFGLLGPNGAGKTTTMRMITNIQVPDSGELLISGKSPSSELQRSIGYLPEERGLYRGMTVRDQLIFFAKIKGLSRPHARYWTDKWLARFELAGWGNRTPGELSKGMQQKIQFIAAVVHDPELLILDEPFTGLDPVNVNVLKEVILNRKRRGKTIIFSTHQMEQVEQICDEICLIDHATKVLGGSLREVKQSYGANTVLLAYNGGDGFLTNDLGCEVKQYPNYAEIKLGKGADAQEVLRRAMAAGASVNRFELVEPSLHDIFIETVKGRNGTDNSRNAA